MLHLKKSFSPHLLSAALSIVIFGLASGNSWIWHPQGPTLLPSGSYALLFAAIPLLLALAAVRGNVRELSLSPQGALVGLVLVYLSDWIGRSYSIFLNSELRGELLVLGLIALVLIRTKSTAFFNLLAPCFALSLALIFFSQSEGGLLFSDDHTVFLYRLSLLKDHFPQIPFYNPMWNAGIDQRDFFAVGSLGVFFVFSPLIYAFPLEQVYTLIVALLLFGFVPASVWLAAKLWGLSKPAPAIAAILALSSSLLWYRWGLKYGTLGFIMSTSLVPLVLALSMRIINSASLRARPPAASLCVLLVISFTLMLLWSPSGIALIPVICFALYKSPSLLKIGVIRRVALSILLINVPWVLLFCSVSNVFSFISAERPSFQMMHENAEGKKIEAPAPSENKAFRSRASGLNFAKTLKIIREAGISTNPLILMLALPGILLLKRNRLILFITLVWLVLLGALLAPMKPQFELDRMLIMAGILCCLPSARAIQVLFYKANRSPLRHQILPAFSGAFLFVGMYCAGGIVGNRSVEKYYFAEPPLWNMAKAISTFAKDGRIIFSGFVLHELNHGHLAPLAYFTGKPLMASSHVHDKWKYSELIPGYFQSKGDLGIQLYLDLFNVSAVFAHKANWREYFLQRPEKFRQVWQDGPFLLFERINFQSNWFLEGSGSLVSQTPHSVTVSLNTPEAVLKFNYYFFLKSSACEVSSTLVEGGFSFVKLSGCPLNQPIVLESKGPSSRFFK